MHSSAACCEVFAHRLRGAVKYSRVYRCAADEAIEIGARLGSNLEGEAANCARLVESKIVRVEVLNNAPASRTD